MCCERDIAVRIRDLLTNGGCDLTPSEAKIAQVILAEYPTSALGTAAALAKRAGVSDPTVVRLATKLGFDGFPAFQAKLLEEVEAGLRSPLMMMETSRPATGGSASEAYMQSLLACMEGVAKATLPQLYDRAIDLIMPAKGRVLLVGGRFSRFVAGMLGSYLLQFRPDVQALGALTAESFDILLDLSARDVLVVFDYRRYQRDVVRFAEQAAERGVQIVLFTDQYQSPIAANAKVTIVAKTEVGSPYDSLAPAVAQVEALLAQIVAKESGVARRRVQGLERIRAKNAVTIEDADDLDR